MALLRRLTGDVLRRRRQAQGKTLRQVSAAARVSLGYLSEVERGRKEASSELLASICDALGVPLSEVLREVSDDLDRAERVTAAHPIDLGPARAGSPSALAAGPHGAAAHAPRRPVGRPASGRPASGRPAPFRPVPARAVPARAAVGRSPATRPGGRAGTGPSVVASRRPSGAGGDVVVSAA